ncbi:hypothetical protein OSTOST_14409, partial [Ostertagia ostertagi]
MHNTAEHAPSELNVFTSDAFGKATIQRYLPTSTCLWEFSTTQFLLRNYTDTRWDKRISISNEQLYQRGVDHSFQIRTRSCTFPLQTWQWTLKLGGSSYSNSVDDVLKAYLISEDIDQPRSIEYMLSIVDEKRVLRSFSSKKNFTKTRYSSELDIDR